MKALNRNKMRTTLTMLGMIIGVAAVITMVALGRGAQDSIEQQIRSAGTNMIIVSAGNWTAGGVRQGQGAAATLTEPDAEAIKQVPGVQYLAAGVSTRQQMVAGNQNWFTRIQGSDVELPLIRVWPLTSGTFFTPQDVNSAAKVVVLGSVVRDNLFTPDQDPVNQIVRIKNQPFKVVGVLASKGQGSMGEDQDDQVFIPYTTAQRKLMGITYLNNVTVSAVSASGTLQVADAIGAMLRVRHKIQPGDPDDFMVRTLEEMANVRTEATKTMTALLAAIAGVSLLVGGIGIMNIMLVSVTERTREIGIRLAIGALENQVLTQFLVEAVALSLFGGITGILLGLSLGFGAVTLLKVPFVFSPMMIAVAFLFSAAIGMIFGYFPARRAAQLNPIEALRHE